MKPRFIQVFGALSSYGSSGPASYFAVDTISRVQSSVRGGSLVIFRDGGVFESSEMADAIWAKMNEVAGLSAD